MWEKGKISFIIILMVMILLFAGLGIRQVQYDFIEASDSLVFRLAETKPEGHPTSLAMEYFAKEVEKMSEGRIQIRVYANQELGDTKEILEQLQFGGIAIASVNAKEYSEAVSALSLFFRPHRYFSAEEMMTQLEHSEEYIRDQSQMERMLPLAWYQPDLYCYYREKAEQEFSNSYIEAGGIGLCELVLKDFFPLLNYVEVDEKIYWPDVLLFSTVVFMDLEKKDRDLLQECAKRTVQYHQEIMKKQQEKYILQLKEKELLFGTFRSEGL